VQYVKGLLLKQRNARRGMFIAKGVFTSGSEPERHVQRADAR
jgi:hypothetical protein